MYDLCAIGQLTYVIRTNYTHDDNKISINVVKFKTPNSKVHGAKMGPIWGRQDPGGPHVGPMNFAIWDAFENEILESGARQCFETFSSSFFFNIYQTSKINGMLRWRQQDVLAELVQRGHICQTWQDMTWRFCSSNINLFYLVSFQNIHIIFSLWYSTFQRDEIQFLTQMRRLNRFSMFVDDQKVISL